MIEEPGTDIEHLITQVPTRLCTKCDTTFPHTNEYFHRNKSGPGGLAAYCKTCMRSSSREANKQNTKLGRAEIRIQELELELYQEKEKLTRLQKRYDELEREIGRLQAKDPTREKKPWDPV